jgi:hypothetical protein
VSESVSQSVKLVVSFICVLVVCANTITDNSLIIVTELRTELPANQVSIYRMTQTSLSFAQLLLFLGSTKLSILRIMGTFSPRYLDRNVRPIAYLHLVQH